MNIKISYQPQYLTPPHAYASVLELNLKHEQIHASLQIEYLGREKLSESELNEFGFTTDDDYSWEGKLSSNWLKDALYFETCKCSKKPNQEIYLHVSANGIDQGYPNDIEHANMLFQELIQAILETDHLEAPLSMHVKLNKKDYSLKWNFNERQFLIDNQLVKDWNQGRDVLNIVYSIDFERVGPMKIPKAPCFSTDTTDWYPINKSMSERLIALLS